MSTPLPSAATITVSQTLALLDGPFREVSDGVARGAYVFWLGSGISRDRVDDVKRIIKRVLDHLQTKMGPGADCPFRVALDRIVALATLSSSDRSAIDPEKAVDTWPCLENLLQCLAERYDGHASDYLVWDALDVRSTFGSAVDPDCEHFCIAILAMEGVAPEIATANWDGLIEHAVSALAAALPVLQVCVREEDLRAPRLRARLLKFHGCAASARRDEGTYRPLLIARQSQITAWPQDQAHTAMRNELVTLSTTRPTLMIGLSAQDSNVQNVFAAATASMKWQWPGTPPAYVFAEDVLGSDQRNILRYVYREAYDRHPRKTEDAARIGAFAKPLLAALVLYVLCAKLQHYARTATSRLPSPVQAAIDSGIVRLRDAAAATAGPDQRTFVRRLVSAVSQSLSLLREGSAPLLGHGEYRALGSSPVHQIQTEEGLSTSGIREAATALGLLGHGCATGLWSLAPGVAPTDGIVRVATGTSPVSRVFFVANAAAAITLKKSGLAPDNAGDAVVVHSTAFPKRVTRAPRAAMGRAGKPRARQVAMRDVLQGSTTLDDLLTYFRREASL
jgi:hypothetical protein